MLKKYLQPLQYCTSKLIKTFSDEMVLPKPVQKEEISGYISKSRLVASEEDVKKLMTSANSIRDVWDFLLKRLQSGVGPLFTLFSIVDESAGLLQIRYLYPQREDKPLEEYESIALYEKENHLVKTVVRSDTTFTNQPYELGQKLYPYLQIRQAEDYHIFSIPLIAGNRSIAVITLGFDQLDSFSQAKLSYVYLLRDQLAQLVWNLVLQEKLQSQSQVDNLTGLITFSSFHEVLKKELHQSQSSKVVCSLLLVDINDFKFYNERYGHKMGDLAVFRLASAIKHHVRGIDTVARYGIDKIAVILPANDRNDAVMIANRFIETLREPDKNVKNFEISIGIVTYPYDANDSEKLINIAEDIMQLGKHRQGKTGQTSVFLADQLEDINPDDRIEAFMTQIEKKYGSNGSDFFDKVKNQIIDQTRNSSENLMLETLASLAGAMDAKDKYTRGHAQSVSNYAVSLATYAGISQAEIEKIRLAALFHDIGKIGIPESILNKPGPLTETEMQIMRQHPVVGARQILQPVTALRDIVPMVEYHHEHWDGTGHPEGLAGEDIPIGARIVAIADAFHALTSCRPYRKALSVEEAVLILKNGAGKVWDPCLISVFTGILQKPRS